MSLITITPLHGQKPPHSDRVYQVITDPDTTTGEILTYYQKNFFEIGKYYSGVGQLRAIYITPKWVDNTYELKASFLSKDEFINSLVERVDTLEKQVATLLKRNNCG